MTQLSVIIAVYNTEQYLEKCLDSVLNQTVTDYEVIAVDDGSTDSSLAILQHYAQQYPHLRILSKENAGQGAARNDGLAIATGTYVTFADSDDWVDLDMYQKMLEVADAEDADIVVCHTIDHYPTHEVFHQSANIEKRYEITPAAYNKIFRRTFVGAVRFPEGVWYEDFEFTTKLLAQTARISKVAAYCYHSNSRPVSTMNNTNAQKNLDMLVVLDHLQKFFEQTQPPYLSKEELDLIVLRNLVLATMNRVQAMSVPEKKAVLAQMKEYAHRYFSAGLSATPAFTRLSLKQRIIARLNFMGLWGIASYLLRIKGGFKHAKG